MVPGTEAYQKYASVEQMIKYMMELHGVSESIKTESIATARNARKIIAPTIKQRYREPVENVIESMSKNINDLKTLQEDFLKTQSDYQAVMLKQQIYKTSTQLHQGISAIVEAERVAGRSTAVGDILDIAESVQAALQSTGVEERSLLAGPNISGDTQELNITAVADLFSAVNQRRIAESTRRSTNLENVMTAEAAYGSAKQLKNEAEIIMAPGGIPSLARMSLPASMADLTKDQAEAIIKASRKIRKGKNSRALTEEEKIITEFAGRVKGRRGDSGILKPGESTEALDAFNYLVGSRQLMQQAEQTATEASQALLTGVDIPQTAHDAVQTSTRMARTAFARGTVYKRFSESIKTGALRDALENKGVKRGLIAAAALSIFGFVHARKKDHSKDDVTGPPLLPGGNPYESGYPARQAVIENIRTLNPVTRGMQYKVYTSGSNNDAESLRSMVSGVADGPVNSTMYSSLPLLGQDPYSQVASRF